MGDPKVEPLRTPTCFKDMFAQNGFWSSCGYDGLSFVFDVPLEAVRSLAEEQKHALMCLLGRLADGGDKALENQMGELETLTARERFTHLVKLSVRFSA